MSKWIKKDDAVIVIAGNEKGNRGKVLVRTGDYVIIEGLNRRKKHLKPRTRTASSQIVEREMPIHVSNVVLASSSGKPIFLKVRQTKEGAKELFYLDEKKEVLHRKL